MVCAQSFAKNFGLYNERVGNLAIVTKNAKYLDNIRAQLSTIVRANYSNPPVHGARIVKTILSNPDLNAEWWVPVCGSFEFHEDLKAQANLDFLLPTNRRGHIQTMSQRIIQMRTALRSKLEELKAPGDWSHITSQIGMFSYTGLSGNCWFQNFKFNLS